MAVAVIDNAILKLSLHCFNRLVNRFQRPLTYHAPAFYGINSLLALKERPKAILLLGSYSNVKDRLPWHKDVADYILKQLKMRTPVLGICFGHQLMADAFGGKIDHVAKEDGFQGLRKFQGKFGEFQITVEHSYEIVQLPKDMSVLGSSKECRYDFVGHNDLPYWGVQGHPEASKHFIEAFKEENRPLEQDFLKAQEDGDRFIEKFFSTFL